MPAKTPAFWQQDGWIAKMLSPLSCLYLAGHKAGQFFSQQPYKASIPVLCVGGVVAGGSGKTPTLHALLDLIRRESLYRNPAILTRGYGGRVTQAKIVNPETDSYEDVGDEALLHAQKATTIAAPNRAEGARLAESIGADIILMDDGLQNNHLHKTASLLVINGDQGLGNGRLLPAGPLREPFTDALAKTSLVICVGNKSCDTNSVPQVRASIIAASTPDTSLPYHAFAGLGDPAKFQRTLKENNVPVSAFTPFADHHPYTNGDIEKLRKKGVPLLTTEKDYVRIPLHMREGIRTYPVRTVFENEAAVVDFLKELR